MQGGNDNASHNNGAHEKIALIAHDHKKKDLIEWARFNRLTLLHHEIYATGTTGRLIEEELGLVVNKLQSRSSVFVNFWPVPRTEGDIRAESLCLFPK